MNKRIYEKVMNVIKYGFLYMGIAALFIILYFSYGRMAGFMWLSVMCAGIGVTAVLCGTYILCRWTD